VLSITTATATSIIEMAVAMNVVLGVTAPLYNVGGGGVGGDGGGGGVGGDGGGDGGGGDGGGDGGAKPGLYAEHLEKPELPGGHEQVLYPSVLLKMQE
jgi:hypothetical protein